MLAEQKIEADESAHRQRIAIVTETYPPEVNGVALTMGHLVAGLRGAGHTVSLVRPRQSCIDDWGNHTDGMILVRGLPLPGYKSLQLGLPAKRLLRRRWTENRPDVVYVATQGPLGWSAVNAARDLRIPVFSGFHTNYHTYSKHYRIGWLHQLVLNYLCSFHNRTESTFVPSAELRERLLKLGFRNVTVLGRGVDSQLFHPSRRQKELRQRWGLSQNDLALLYVGRLAPEKNLSLAIEAYRAVKKIRPTARFILVGNGPTSAALQCAHPDLVFCGLQTGVRLAEHYASADMFLFPSETETFGNVTLEAMASGLAVVAYNYAAARLHIVSGHTGLLAPYGDAQAFIDSTLALAQTRDLVRTIGRAARSYITSVAWPQVVNQFEMLLGGGDEKNNELTSSRCGGARSNEVLRRVHHVGG
jgi:glycosyltransferase involved in cell wall biosynthesis